MTKTAMRRCALAILLFCTAGAANAQVVISQVYGGGGNSGATWTNDFIELRNNGTTAIDVSGWSVQYASSSGTSWQRTNLGGSIAPGGYYLVQENAGAGGTTPLPAPDATGTISMSASSGKVALVENQTTLSGSCPLGAAVRDFVGFGSADCFEGSDGTPALSNTKAALRKGDGLVDTDDNAADFQASDPNPRNGGYTPPPPPPPPTALSIPEIQGAGLASPHVGENVVTEGVVTALKYNNGFFLQDPAGDGDPATSDGVFVYTGSAPSVHVGDRVRVTATVQEFTPASNPSQLSITELGAPTVEVLGSGEALPAPMELGATELSPTATPATLEHLEGMRASLAHSLVIGASDGSINEANATSTSDGVFYVTLPGTATPFREPGLDVLDAIPVPADKNPPRFDHNPERLMVRSYQQIGAHPLSVDDGAQVDGLVGVLDYYDADWALLPDAATPPTVSGGMAPQPVADADYEDVTIGGFNLERFFDDVDDGNSAPTLTAAALDKRLGKTSAAICDFVKAPDILGVVEVENLRVLQLLADRINATCPRAPDYTPYLAEGNDVGGIDVGFLVSTRDNGAGVARVEVREVTQYGKDATFANPDGSTSLLNDRPPLLLRAIVHQDNGASYPVTVVVNHLRSLNDVDSIAVGSNGWPTTGARVRGKRAAQAAYLAGLVQQLQEDDPSQHVVLLGDFNAFEFNDGYVDVLGIIRGNEVPEDQVLTWVPSPVATPLVDGSSLVADPAQRYSYVFQGNAQALDHALLNQSLLGSALGVRVDHARINADFGVDNFGDASVPVRVSDHDPVRIAIAVPAFRSADLAATVVARAGSAHVGDTAWFDADLANAGPNAAESVGVAFVFDAAVSPAVTAPAGWSCQPPVVADTTSVTCNTASLGAGEHAAFAIAVVAPDANGGGMLHLAMSAASQIADPANGNNDASAGIAVDADADLAVSVSGPSKKLHYGRVERFPVSLRNDGPDAAWKPVLVLRGDAPAANVAIAAPTGWNCVTSDAGNGSFATTCVDSAGLAAHAGQGFDFAITIPTRPDSTQSLNLRAEVSANTPDPEGSDNTASYSNRIVGVP
jgi:predicted extracellular nuclease